MTTRRSPSVAVVTMLRDDLEFLSLWMGYYGGLFGRDALYVVNDGNGPAVRAAAQGAHVIGLPGAPHKNFDGRRWRMLNHLVQGLRIYHDWVIVSDVDELILVDPDHGTLPQMLAAHRKAPVLTPLGLDLVHRPDLEPEPFGTPLLSRRRHVRLAPLYSKPCLVRDGLRISRGGHYSSCPTLTQPEGLYLLHLKHCDRALYETVLDRRNAVVAATGVARPKDALIGRHWFASTRDDAREFAQIDQAPLAERFDMGPARAAMAASWRPRKDTEFWEAAPPADPHIYRLPERFAGLL